jgi:hypothetical protein
MTSIVSLLPTEHGWGRLHDNTAIKGGNPSFTSVLGSAPISSKVRINCNGLWYIAYTRHGPIVGGIGPFGMQPGSSTAASNATRSPSRNAASIFLKVSYSLQRSRDDFIVIQLKYLGANTADNIRAAKFVRAGTSAHSCTPQVFLTCHIPILQLGFRVLRCFWLEAGLREDHGQKLAHGRRSIYGVIRVGTISK